MADRGGRGRGRGGRGRGRGWDQGGQDRGHASPRGGGRGAPRVGYQAPPSGQAFDMRALASAAGDLSRPQGGRGGVRGGPRGRGGRGRGGRGRGRGRPVKTENYDVVSTRPSLDFKKEGCSGTQVELLTNYLGFHKCPNKCLFKYRVDFKADVQGELETFTKKRLFSRLAAQLPPFLFDGSMLYLPTKTSALKHTSSLDGGQAVPIELRLISELHPTDNDYVHFYNMIKQSAIEKLGLKQMKRDFYDPGGVIHKPEWNIDLWPGYKTTIRQHENELLLGVEVTHKMLRTDSAWGTISNIQQRYGNGPECIRQIKRALMGSIVISNYNNKTYRVDDVDFNTTPASTFEKKDGSRISFKDYYQERYNITVRNLNQPMLISMPKDKDKRRGDLSAVKIIPELTHMTGITDEQRANYQMMNALSEWTRMTPNKRVEAIQTFSRRLMTAPEVSAELDKWNMEINPSLKTALGRVLNPETIYLKTETTYQSSNADWGNRLRDGMMEHKEIPKIAIVVARQIMPQGKAYWDKLKRIAPSLNIGLGEPRWFEVPDSRVTSYTSVIEKTVAGKTPDMTVVMIPKVDGEMYSTLKKLMTCRYAMLSQVITAQKILNRDKQAESTATKILIQMATKLGARPWLLRIPPKDVMVAGYDAQKNKDRGGKSFGAFAASMDKDFGRYYSRAMYHEGHEEICQFIGQMTMEALQSYQKNNSKLPKRLIFYRDGVGEGQLEEVRENEIKAIKNVVGDMDIKLTFIVVSKRINTRLFQKGSDGNMINPHSGTIADTVVTLPERYDFFLISQSVGQGTVNPTNYNVILDESGWTPDRIQVLTYKLTHLYYNWPGTIRVPAPCMYAHKLADLLGAHLKQEPNPAIARMCVLYYL